VVTPPLRSKILCSSTRNWQEKRGTNGKLFLQEEGVTTFLLFGAILEECVTCKARWELRKSHTTNETEIFLEKHFFISRGEETAL